MEDSTYSKVGWPAESFAFSMSVSISLTFSFIVSMVVSRGILMENCIILSESLSGMKVWARNGRVPITDTINNNMDIHKVSIRCFRDQVSALL
ncbi:hypothetical protein D3C87_1893240 [compost metagenome]